MYLNARDYSRGCKAEYLYTWTSFKLYSLAPSCKLLQKAQTQSRILTAIEKFEMVKLSEDKMTSDHE